ncbi:hypothetical protein ACWKWU_08275 [Chitinophaga lutea]
MPKKPNPLRDRLYADFTIDLPIAGGAGNSIEDCIILTNESPIHFAEVQYTLLDLLGKQRRLDWEVHHQQLLEVGPRTIDKITVRFRAVAEDLISYSQEHFYFDITDCLEQRLQQDGEQ